jgi:hypothetical protein
LRIEFVTHPEEDLMAGSFSTKRQHSSRQTLARKQSRPRLASAAASVEQLEFRRLFSGTWTTLTNAAPGAIGTMELLPNGKVLATTDGDGAGNNWALLTPSSTGSYVSGTWTQTANANDTRLFDSTDVLQNGNVFVAGGEDGNGDGTAEIYNPGTNTWTLTPSQPYGNFADSLSTVIANGDVLITPVSPDINAGTTLYNPNTNTWSQGPQLPYSFDADEQGGVLLPDGSFLTVYNNQSERYIPAQNKWITDAGLPASLTDGLGEYGVATLLPNGNAFFIGAGGNSAIYTPSGSTANGSWVAGPSIPGGLGEDDAAGAMLRDGNFLITAGPSDSYNGPTTMYTYNWQTNSFSAFSGPNTYSGPPFLTRMLALPNGDLLYSENGNTLYQYDPGDSAPANAVPTITSIVHNTNGTMTLTGTNLNGINVGATYGDDAQMSTNYPLVRFSSGSNVYYASSYNWSNTGVMLGSTSETVNFTLPLGIPAGTYSVVVAANGVASTATSLTISTTSPNAAPTIATAASVNPTIATGTTAALSVLGADDGGQSNLTYTWVNTSAPAGGQLASFSINGTNSAANTTAIFHEIGTYTFDVVITDAGGLSVTSGTVSVTVNQTLSSISVAPTPNNLTAGQTQQLTANGYDQFGSLMNVQPVFTWAVTAGGGTVSPAGIYTAPATGTLATVTATTGSLSAKASMYVVNLPWTSADVGTVNAVGTAYDSSTTTTLTDTSDDIWNASDDFHFDYQELAGNVTITAELNSQNSASTYIKAGVMIRNSLSASDAMAMEADPSPGPLFEWRTTSGGTAAQDATSASTNPPYWVRLVRNGNVITGYSSPNGVTWTQTGTQTITMGTDVYVGLALSSHDTSNSATAVFSNVSIVSSQTLTSVSVVSTPVNLTTGQTRQLIAEGFDQNGFAMSTQPAFTWSISSGGGTISSTGLYTATTGTLATVTASSGSLSAAGTVAVVNSPWTSTDIGTLGIAGTAYDSGSTTTLSDASDDIWNQSDDFHFDYQTMTGNGTITAELNSQTSASTYIKAGVMMRNSLAANDAMTMISDPAPGADFEWRTTAGGTAAQTVGASTNLPYWVRIVRNGNLFSGYISANGVTWGLVGTQTISMNATIYVGLALTSHNPADLATAVFSNVSINNPTVATAAAATPNPVTTRTTTLSVLGANTPNSAGESSLTYNWAATTLPSGATTPTFSTNGTNAAKSVVATFYKAGSYTFTVTIKDAVGDTVTSAVNVTVNTALTTITVTPTTSTLNDAQSTQFSAAGYDQFGAALTSQPSFTWSLAGGSAGSVNSSGFYSAPASGAGSATVQATSGSVTGTAAVTVNLSVIAGTTGNDVIRLVRSGTSLLLYVDNSTTPLYTVAYSSVGSLTIAPSAGNDTINVDFSGGATPVPVGGLTVTGGSGSNTLIVTGTTGNDTADINTSTVTLNGSGFNYSAIASIIFDGDGGSDTLIQSAQPGNSASLGFNGGLSGGTSASDTLDVNAGTYTFPTPTTGGGIQPVSLAALSIANGASVVIPTATAVSDRSVLIISALSLGGATSLLDMGGNDLILHNTDANAASSALTTISSELATGFAGGAWNGDGISSSAIAASDNPLLALGSALDNGIYSAFDNQPTVSTDLLIKFTYYGDATLDGQVDGSDYSRIDNGFLNQLTGWSNGDFNYDGIIDGSDYTLIDNAFNTQGATLAAEPTAAVVTPTAHITKAPMETNKSASKASHPTLVSPGVFQSQSQITPHSIASPTPLTAPWKKDVLDNLDLSV